ncbi:hypothetical protein V491_07882 [Pseudogymnoascus sp. VKM F-3775]|nr:hypothetical protein V491_07882 [Pseudogymnoascus sp. VKM F-3775]
MEYNTYSTISLGSDKAHAARARAIEGDRLSFALNRRQPGPQEMRWPETCMQAAYAPVTMNKLGRTEDGLGIQGTTYVLKPLTEDQHEHE